MKSSVISHRSVGRQFISSRWSLAGRRAPSCQMSDVSRRQCRQSSVGPPKAQKIKRNNNIIVPSLERVDYDGTLDKPPLAISASHPSLRLDQYHVIFSSRSENLWRFVARRGSFCG